MPIPPLNDIEVRVLGTLMEKEATTPEYYPLSLNALVNGCNQKSNREPVVNYDSDTVETSLESLREKKFAFVISGTSRVAKFSQRISETLNLGRRESAVLCTLLLRGPQTLGEIKDRSERMFPFGDLAETETVLERLSDPQSGSLVTKLARQPGHKEARYAHLLSGEPAIDQALSEAFPAAPPNRVTQLEAELKQLRSDFNDLKSRFDNLEAQLR